MWDACRYSTHLHGALSALVADTEAEVRVQMAAGFHECAVLLGRDRCVQYMRRCSLAQQGHIHTLLCFCLLKDTCQMPSNREITELWEQAAAAHAGG